MIICKECGCPDSNVLSTEKVKKTRQRRRKCIQCGHTWITMEMSMNAWKWVEYGKKIFAKKMRRDQ